MTMENIIDRENIHAAVLAVERNKGAPGIDGLTTLQLRLLLSLDPEVEAVSQPSVLNVKSLILFAFC
jgi:hypothetical protein